MGPADDSTLMLSGHPEKLPAPEVDRKAMESKGLVVTADFTAWIGPWGITYSANLTPDETGLGNWKEDQFLYAVKNSISKGLAGGRPLMPPMSMMPAKHMTDDELKAIFAYLKTIAPASQESLLEFFERILPSMVIFPEVIDGHHSISVPEVDKVEYIFPGNGTRK